MDAAQKWNEFVAALVSSAGLPSTSLVRLSFTDAELQHTHALGNFDDLKRLSLRFGVRSDTHILLRIRIEILTLNYTQYGKRVSFERAQFVQNVKEEHTRFELSALSATNAVVRRALQLRHVVQGKLANRLQLRRSVTRGLRLTG